jgi:hypothetical protein
LKRGEASLLLHFPLSWLRRGVHPEGFSLKGIKWVRSPHHIDLAEVRLKKSPSMGVDKTIFCVIVIKRCA